MDSGLLLYQEHVVVLNPTAIGSEDVGDGRTGKIIRRGRAALLRLSVLSRQADYQETNKADRMRFFRS
ncbi:MAG: hypothetical protein DRP71_09975 [Verrucomicrobia bacterium]|nr:MAG: hypothetical protein DRP71_09975 [Verrucomicrobiota bacterium]